MTIERDALKRTVWEAINERRSAILALASEIYSHPELGYKEHKTAALRYPDLLKLRRRAESILTNMYFQFVGKKSGHGSSHDLYSSIS